MFILPIIMTLSNLSVAEFKKEDSSVKDISRLKTSWG